MIKITLTLVLLLVSTTAWSQVGIGTTTPSSSLDIIASNIALPSNTDGILIPRVNQFSATNPTALQDGMLVYLTTTFSGNAPGFYYWSNASINWVAINSPKNTLNNAYNQGGLGLGRIITANNGALEIQGTDGLIITTDMTVGNLISHGGDTNTFIKFTPDRVQITAGGRNYMDIQHANQEITFNEGSTQTDFRIESGLRTHLFFTDGSADVIGINNATPKALIDMTATSITAPTKTDGLLIPRMDEYPAAPDGDQNGMLVFITGNGAPTKGVYYWDWNGASGAWVGL